MDKATVYISTGITNLLEAERYFLRMD